MTKEEIKAMIAQKIEGQGTNVDGGGVLGKVLTGLLDSIEEEVIVKPERVSFDGNL